MYSQISANKRKTYLLIAVFTIVIWAIGYVAGWYFDFGYGPLAIAFFISIIMSFISFYSGDKIALAMSGAKEIQQADNPYVFRMVENLAITAGLPVPKVYIIEDEALNAFATGRDPQHASVAVTSGLIKALENEELEGVLAHELSHVQNYDIRVMMIVIVCVGVITLLADSMMRSFFWGGGRRRSNDNGRGGAVLLILGLILAIVAPIFAKLIQLAVSRKREYLADASGALLTRYPEGLARALEKISQSQPLKKVNRATAHLFIAEPTLGPDEQLNNKKKSGFWTNIFSTHPPISDRIAKLRGMIR